MTTAPEFDSGESRYPMHDKLAACSDQSQAVGEFLEWMDQRGYVLARPDRTGHFWPMQKSIKEIVAEWLDIDLTGLELEKLQMLDDMREFNTTTERQS